MWNMIWSTTLCVVGYHIALRLCINMKMIHIQGKIWDIANHTVSGFSIAHALCLEFSLVFFLNKWDSSETYNVTLQWPQLRHYNGYGGERWLQDYVKVISSQTSCTGTSCIEELLQEDIGSFLVWGSLLIRSGLGWPVHYDKSLGSALSPGE